MHSSVDVCPRTLAGRVLALGVVPALVVAAVLVPQAWEILAADVDLPLPVAPFAIGGTLIWLPAALVAWAAGAR